ncbi:Calmodulin-binding transcription activator 5, partial [Mucuna pruriens]
MTPPIPILSLMKQPLLWRCIGFLSSITGLLSYALSSSFKHLFGEWNLLKIILYGVWSIIMCSVVLLAKKWKLSRSLTLKARVGFLVLMLTSVYSFFYDKAVNGKPDVLGLISCASFAFMSFSLSRQIDLGFEVDLLNFFLGCLMVQLMKINLMLASIGGVFSYFLIILRSSLDSQQEIATATNHVAIEIDIANSLETGANIGTNNAFQSEYNNIHRRELPSLRKRHFVTTVPDKVYLKNANRRSADDAMCIQAEFREHILKELTEFQFSDPEAEARKIVAAMKIQHAFRNYKTRKMAVAATRIQHTFRARKIRKESLNIRHQAIKIQ